MALFESYERRINQINAVLNSYYGGIWFSDEWYDVLRERIPKGVMVNGEYMKDDRLVYPHLSLFTSRAWDGHIMKPFHCIYHKGFYKFGVWIIIQSY